MPHLLPVWAVVIAASFCISHALAQGNDASSSSSGGTKQQDATVQIGAGALTDTTTTGVSGPRSSQQKAKPAPLPPSFSIKPEGDAYWGPYQLKIRSTVIRRCSIIEDLNARTRCNVGQTQPNQRVE